MRICFFGDSMTNGTGDAECLGWVGRVCARMRQRGHDLTAYNLGIRRETSRDIAARWQEEAAARLPDDFPARLVFSFGVNDACQGFSVEESLGHARAILAGAGHPVLIIGPAPIADEGVNRRTAQLSAAFAQLGVPYLDVFTPLSASETWMREVAAWDGAHPGAAGYEVLADLVDAWDAWKGWFAKA